MPKPWISYEGLEHWARYCERRRNWAEHSKSDFKRYRL